jgi:hypothetical protein
MLAPALLIATYFAAQTASGSGLSAGQELVYRGTYSETARHDGTPFRREYELETRVFVCASEPHELRVAFCTILRDTNRAGSAAARLEMGSVDRQGRIRLANTRAPTISPDGPPSLECAGFLERPTGEPEEWTDSKSEPIVRWRGCGTEVVNGVRSLKYQGVQQTPNWDRPISDRATWRRVETVWVAATTGLVVRLERVLDWRRVGRRSEVQSRTVYDLNGGISTYPDPLGQDRQREIQAAARFQDALAGLARVRSPGPEYGRVLRAIDAHLAAQPATPYRAAIEEIRRQAEAAQRGEPPPPGRP